MNKELTDLSDRCGSCKFFMYRVVDDTIKKWGGHCTKPNRKTYHDRSQKACKLYEPYNDSVETKYFYAGNVVTDIDNKFVYGIVKSKREGE